MDTITCYLVIAKFDYGIDFWLGAVSSDEDSLMSLWNSYLQDFERYAGTPLLPEFIGIHKVEHTIETQINVLCCPFCGHVTQDLRDALHPSTTRWRVDNGVRHYISHRDPRDGERCWEMNCLTHEGGCGAHISADSRDEVIKKWNNRAT